MDRFLSHRRKSSPARPTRRRFHPWVRRPELRSEAAPLGEVLAFYVVTRCAGAHPLPPALREPFATLEQRLRTDAALRRRCARLARRLARLEGGAPPDVLWRKLSGGDPPR